MRVSSPAVGILEMTRVLAPRSPQSLTVTEPAPSMRVKVAMPPVVRATRHAPELAPSVTAPPAQPSRSTMLLPAPRLTSSLPPPARQMM